MEAKNTLKMSELEKQAYENRKTDDAIFHYDNLSISLLPQPEDDTNTNNATAATGGKGKTYITYFFPLNAREVGTSSPLHLTNVGPTTSSQFNSGII